MQAAVQGWKGGLLLAVALAGAACATTTAGAVSNDQSQRLAGANAAPDAGVANPDQPSEQPGVVVTATSLTNVQFSTGSHDTVVPLRPVLSRTPTRRRIWVQHGMLFGAMIGAAAGAIAGSAADRRDAQRGPPECDPLCGGHVLPDSLGLAALGLGVGAIVGLLGSQSP